MKSKNKVSRTGREEIHDNPPKRVVVGQCPLNADRLTLVSDAIIFFELPESLLNITFAAVVHIGLARLKGDCWQPTGASNNRLQDRNHILSLAKSVPPQEHHSRTGADIELTVVTSLIAKPLQQ